MKKILLIEDDFEICEVIKKYFTNKGTEIYTIQNGKEALCTAKYNLSSYELILLDIMLPDIDGFTICREIRKNSDIPGPRRI